MLDRLFTRWLQARPPDDQDQDQDPNRGIATTTITARADTDVGLPVPFGTRKVPKFSSKLGGRSNDAECASGASISRPIRSSPVSLTGLDAPDSDFDPYPGLDSSSGSGSGSGRWHYQYPYPYPYNTSNSHPSPTRSGPSNVEWMVESAHGAVALPPPVVRVASSSHRFVARSASAPILSAPMPASSSSSSSTPSSSSASVSTKGALKVNTSAIATASSNTNPFTQSSYTLSTGMGTASVSTDVYNHAYNYPLAKQLSPILEQDYFSPVSLRTHTTRSGSGSGSQGRGSFGYAMSMTSARSGSGSSTSGGNGRGSPGSSVKSEVARPSPSFSGPHPFITRQLNRTVSQGSTSSSLRRTSPSSAAPTPQQFTQTATNTYTDPDSLSCSSLPGLAPPFHGLQASPSKDGTRVRRSYVGMPTIAGSSESGAIDEASEVYGGEDDSESLHAESFITAADERRSRAQVEDEEIEIDIADDDVLYQVSIDGESTHSLNPKLNFGQQHQSTSSLHASPDPALPSSHPSNLTSTSSYIPLRWDLDAPLGTSVVIFPLLTKNTSSWLTDHTPAFWAFWLGFLFPVLWFVGGWHFTSVGECPTRVGIWEFYFFGNAGMVWRRVSGWLGCGCCGRRKERGKGARDLEQGGRTGKEKEKVCQEQMQGPRLPRWVTEKQSSDASRLRLQDPKRSLRGISFGYPFIPRPVSARQTSVSLVRPARWRQRVMWIVTKPHRLYDCFYGVKLREVRGRPESGRRMFDPWIQRCRYAFCYALFGLCVGLCVACTLLIVLNTRQLG